MYFVRLCPYAASLRVFLQINSLLDLPVTNLRAVCTTEEHCRLDKLIQELNVSVNTLRCELRPQDDYHSVEKELELALHQTEDLEHGQIVYYN